MKKKQYFLIFFSALFCNFLFAQSPGLIYKPASTALGRSVLDPNGDGFSSLTTSGFSGTDYGSTSELKLIPLPVVSGEPVNDLSTGSNGGHTDIASFGNNSNQSCYVLYKNVGGVNYLIIRFRIGGASTAPKGYSFLMDTDGVFGTIGANGNPGFDKEIVLQTGSGGVVAVYSHTSTTTTAGLTFPIDEYSQRSIALSTNSGDADYFYDFFIPYSALGLTNEPVRITAATVTSAGSGITGSKSDYNGINDKLYGNDPLAIGKALILTFPATPLTSLVEGFNYSSPQSITPVVNGGITTSNTTISGTSLEANGTTITIYKNGISIGTTTVTNNTWTLTGVSGLVAGNSITATATASGKTVSASSASIEVVGVQSCFVTPPTFISATSSGSAFITVGWTFPSTAASGATALIELFTVSGTNSTYTLAGTAQTITYPATTLVYSLGTNGAVKGIFAARVTYSGCTSYYSNLINYGNSNITGNITPVSTLAPTIQTTPVYASTGSQNIVVKNNHTASATITFYVNSSLRATSASAIGAGLTTTFSITGLIEGDQLMSRAQGLVTNSDLLSDISNIVTVQASATPTSAPSISGTYIAGASQTVNGTSTEAAGTIIYLYNGATLIGTTTVTAYGTWTISGITLTSGNVLTATAKATGKTISPSSTQVTVQASAPSAPTISGSYQAGATSISGTGGVGTVTVYVDGSPIGTTTQTGAWTLTGFSAIQLYKGAKITATNTSSGIESVLSNEIIVTGVNSFIVTNTSDGNIGTQTAGVSFPIKIVAKDGLNGTGNTVSTFTSAVTLSSSSAIGSGGGKTSNFTSGILNPHNLNLTTSGSNKTITVVSVDDPTAIGTATVSLINPSVVYKFTLNSPSDIVAGSRASFTVTRTDVYDNLITSGAQTVYLFSSGTTGAFYDMSTGGNLINSISIPNGQSSVNFWFTATLVNSYTITTSDANPANGISGILDANDSIGVTVGTASNYLVTTSSSTANQGTTVTISAQLVDQYNNPVTTSGLTVNWTATNGGSFSGLTSTTNSSGIATITYTVSNTIGTTHVISATTGSYTGQSPVITVTPSPPTISSFTPSTACPGGTVIINGTNLSLVTSVSFSGTSASSFNIINDTTISAVVGFVNTSGNVSVTNGGGTANLGGFMLNSTTWNGTTWSNNSPDGTKAIIFNANYTIGNDLSACSIQVSNNSTVIVNSGYDVTLSGAIVVDSGSSFTLSSNSNLIQTSNVSNTGNIIVNRQTFPLLRLDYSMWSAPVLGQNLLNFSPNTLTNRFYNYNPTTNLYNVVSSPSTTDFVKGTGYLIRMPNNHPTTPTIFNGTFTGVPNNGLVTLTVTSNTYNAIGNPYPSTISADSFISTNNLTEALYFWRKTNNSANPSYATYTLAGATGTSANTGGLSSTVPNGKIQVGQGFIAKSIDTDFEFNNSMRIGNNENQFFRNSNLTERNRIWLNLTDSNGYFCQTMFGYMPGATQGIDPSIDGRYINDVQTALTTIINNEEFAIQGKPLPFSDSDVVQLGFKTITAGTFTISIDQVDGLFSFGQEIYIKDNLTNSIFNLNNGSYSFYSEIGVFNSRFEIVYVNNALNNNAYEFNSNSVIVYKRNQKIVINTFNVNMSNVKIYDISGRLLNEKSEINSNELIMDAPTSNEMILVKITSQNEETLTKKIIL